MGKFSKSNFDDSLLKVIDKVGEDTSSLGNKTIITTVNDIASTIPDSNDTNLVDKLNEAKAEAVNSKRLVINGLKSLDPSLSINENSSWEDAINAAGNVQTGIDINGVVEQYRVYAGENISAGDFVKFIDSYQELTDNNQNSIEVLERVGKSDEAKVSNIISKTVSKNRVLVIYRSSIGTTTTAVASLIKLDGNKIEVVDTIEIFKGTYFEENMDIIDENRVIFVCNDMNVMYPAAVILKFVNDKLTRGNLSYFRTVDGRNITVAVLTKFKALIVYRNVVTTHEMRAVVCNINDTTLSFTGDIKLGLDYTSYAIKSIRVSDTNAIVLATYQNNNFGYSVMIYNFNVSSSNVISLINTVYTMNNSNASKSSDFIKISDTNYVIAVAVANKTIRLFNVYFSNTISVTATDTLITEAPNSAIQLNRLKDDNYLLTSVELVDKISYLRLNTFRWEGTNFVSDEVMLLTPNINNFLTSVLIEDNKVLNMSAGLTGIDHTLLGTGPSNIIKPYVSKSLNRDEINGLAIKRGTAGNKIEVKTL